MECELSVVIPAFNEQDALPATLSRVLDTISPLVSTFEIIIVDDGSRDGTFDLLLEAHKKTPEIKGIQLSRQFGKEAALYAGLRHANGKAVITMDADLQHPAEVIPDMIAHWRKGAEIVHGVKRTRETDSFVRRMMASLFNTIFLRLSGFDLRGSSDFKLLDRSVVDVLIEQLPERGRFFRGLSAWVGYRQVSLPFDVAPRKVGESRWGGLGLLRYAIRTITAFSSLPLSIVPALGLLMLFISVLLGIETIWSKLSGQSISGFATLEITILFTGSLIMIGLGVIGQYLARIFDEVKERPVCLISNIIGLDHSDNASE